MLHVILVSIIPGPTWPAFATRASRGLIEVVDLSMGRLGRRRKWSPPTPRLANFDHSYLGLGLDGGVVAVDAFAVAVRPRTRESIRNDHQRYRAKTRKQNGD